VRPLLDRKSLALVLEIGPEVGEMSGDRRRLEQVLVNLLGNAVKFTDQGSVSVRASSAEGRIRVEVADTGIGIDAAHKDKLFRPFSQIDTGLARAHEGTGLGLSVSRHLIELMGGTIDVESAPGAGSTFFFTLPVDPPRAQVERGPS